MYNRCVRRGRAVQPQLADKEVIWGNNGKGGYLQMGKKAHHHHAPRSSNRSVARWVAAIAAVGAVSGLLKAMAALIEAVLDLLRTQMH